MLYLSDVQYRELLRAIYRKVMSEDFVPKFADSNATGDSYTDSNCGFCSEDFTDSDTALWPDKFPKRRSLKYRTENHRCPLDTRSPALAAAGINFGIGCFYNCFLFQAQKLGMHPDEMVMAIRRMVRECLEGLSKE